MDGNIWSVVGDISNVIATGLAAFGIYVTIREQREARKYDNNRILLEQKFMWYNELMLHEVVSSISELIEYSREQIEHCKVHSSRESLEADLKQAYERINNKTKFTEEKVHVLKIFSDNLYRKCHDGVQSIFDLFSTGINESQTKKYVVYISEYEVQRKKTEIFKLLYQELEFFIEEMK